MLKMCGSIYGQTKEDFETFRDILEKAGYQIAYQSQTGGAIIEEVEDADEQ